MPDPKGGNASDVHAAPAPKLEVAPEVAADAPPPVGDPVIPSDEVDPAGGGDAATLLDAKPDAETEKRLATISKAEKRMRDEQATARAQLELDRAALARQKAEIDARGTSLEDLRTLAKKPGGRLAVLEKLGLSGEDDLEVFAREAYANSKSGKLDPKNKAYAEQTAEKREYQTKLDQLEQRHAELEKKLEARDAAAKTEALVSRYLDEAVKAVPKTPTLIGNLLAKNPAKARAALLGVAQHMERESGETPTHAEAIAEFEKRYAAELDDLGIPLDVALKRTAAVPAATTPPAKKPGATLDPTATGGAKPVDRTKLNPDQRMAEIVKDMPWPG